MEGAIADIVGRPLRLEEREDSNEVAIFVVVIIDVAWSVDLRKVALMPSPWLV